jgi:RNA polymerase sigma-54 factor
LKAELKQSQQFRLSQDFQRSLNILEMSNIELKQYIEELIDSNPFLEKEDLKENNEACDDERNIRQFIENHYIEKDLMSYLEEQIRIEFRDIDFKIAKYLCDFLDDKGYFKGDIEDISLTLKVPPTKVKKILEKLKGLEPIGIFAVDLAECLKIQLQQKGLLDKTLEIILANLELVAKVDLSSLAKLVNKNLDEVIQKISLIKQLNPKPASLFVFEPTISIIPDLILTITEFDFNLEMNYEVLPKILFNKDYYQSLKMEIKDKDGKKYLSDSSKGILDVIRHLRQRNTTMLLVATEIIREQIDFFVKGIKSLKPLTINFIADKVNLHISTISRVTKNKYISTPRGIFELKYFFSKAIDSGKEINSNKVIKEEIFNIIERESIDNIYSDEAITLILIDKGYKISRRTVVKYREQLKILNSNHRKKQKLLKNI